MSDALRVPETRCLICGKALSAVSAAQGDAKPKPGDPITCIYCGAVCTIGRDGKLRPMTESEASIFTSDEEWMGEMRKLVGVIRFLKAAKN